MTECHDVNYLFENVVTCMKMSLLQWTLSETGYPAATAALPWGGRPRPTGRGPGRRPRPHQGIGHP